MRKKSRSEIILAVSHARTKKNGQGILRQENFFDTILERREVPTPLTDAVENMKVITTMIKNSVSLP